MSCFYYFMFNVCDKQLPCVLIVFNKHKQLSIRGDYRGARGNGTFYLMDDSY